MMLKPSIDKLLDKVPSKYSLVILQAKRAHELAAGAEPTQEFTSVKPTLQALEEIETGNVTIHPDPESKRELARLKVIQARLAAEEEERKIKEQIAKEKEEGDKINVVVPTGNFGNILAAYYAKKMGLPVAKFICASNANNVLTDFIRTGVYDRNRPFHTTISPSMDILISSNLERLLYDMADGDDAVIRGWFASLASDGRYEVSDAVKQKLSQEFYGGYCNDEETKATIKHIFDKYSYLCDSHTAVAVKVYEDYLAQTGDHTKTIIASTANPFKFAGSVLEAVTGAASDADEFEQVRALSRFSGVEAPKQLAELENKTVRFDAVVSAEEMARTVLENLGIK